MSTFTEKDLILINRGGVDYQTTLAELREYVHYEPPLPWYEHVAKGGVVFHVKDATGTVYIEHISDFYDINGTFKGKRQSFDPGEEVVILADDIIYFFRGNNGTTWNFGELTDVSNATELDYLFDGCQRFNGTGLSDWDTSNVGAMGYTFSGCSSFNQDLSQWCVSLMGPSSERPHFDDGCTSWQAIKKPVWGTCPRGEDQ